jgi:hypothetical protein
VHVRHQHAFMEKMMREAFEKRYPGVSGLGLLQRRGEGYSWGHINTEWQLWCEAWQAALS